MTVVRVKSCRTAVRVRLLLWIALAVAAIASPRISPAACPPFLLPPLSEQAANPPRFQASDGAPASFYHVRLANVAPGYSVTNGEYLAWCIDYWVPLPIETFINATLYDSSGPLPPFLQDTNWDMVNYILNHKRGTAFDVQGAIWRFIGGPVPPSDPAFNPPSPATLLMVDDALANGEGYIPTGPGAVVAVIVDAGPDIQTLVIEASAPVSRPPVANPDLLRTLRNTPISTNANFLLANDLSPNGASLQILSVSPDSTHGGTVTLSGPTLVYTPPAGFTGLDMFAYTISDGVCDTATTMVTVVVSAPQNQAPTATADSLATLRDQSITNPATFFLANDSDPDGDLLTLVAVSTNSAHGGTVILIGSDVVYSPPVGFTGLDTFTYSISDGQGGTATATVTVTVTRPNGAPTPMNDVVSTLRDQPISIPGAQILANDSDPDGDPLTLVSVSASSTQSGTVTIVGTNVVYVPPAGFVGTDTFSYTVSDGQGGTATAMVTVDVLRPNAPPAAMNDMVETLRDQSIVIPTAQLLANDSDADGDHLMIIAVSTNSTQGGIVVLNGTNILYTPPPGFVGTDTFTYTVDDGHGGTATATVTVTVTRPNTAPIARNDSVTTDQNVSLHFGTALLLANDTDADGDTLVVTAMDMVSTQHGAIMLDGTNVLYFPPLDFIGQDTFNYTIGDGHGGTGIATVTVTVNAPNHPPMAGNFAFTTLRDTPLLIAFSTLLSLASDPDGDTVHFERVLATAIAGGIEMITNDNVRYVPSSGFTGTHAFSYVVNDGRGLSATGTVTITVLESPMGMIEEAAIFNPQTGLFDQRVTVSNESSNTLAAFRIYISNLRTNIRVWNATGVLNGTNYIQYNSPLNPGQSATFRIEYYVPDRLPFTPVLTREATMPVPQPPAHGTEGIAIDRPILDTRIPEEPRFVIGFASIPGRIYTIIYSDDMISWKAATPSVPAVANHTQWYDDGPPKTDHKPLAQGARFYRVIQAP